MCVPISLGVFATPKVPNPVVTNLPIKNYISNALLRLVISRPQSSLHLSPYVLLWWLPLPKMNYASKLHNPLVPSPFPNLSSLHRLYIRLPSYTNIYSFLQIHLPQHNYFHLIPNVPLLVSIFSRIILALLFLLSLIELSHHITPHQLINPHSPSFLSYGHFKSKHLSFFSALS